VVTPIAHGEQGADGGRVHDLATQSRHPVSRVSLAPKAHFSAAGRLVGTIPTSTGESVCEQGGRGVRSSDRRAHPLTCQCGAAPRQVYPEARRARLQCVSFLLFRKGWWLIGASVKGFDIDTSWFSGNEAPAVSVEALATDPNDSQEPNETDTRVGLLSKAVAHVTHFACIVDNHPPTRSAGAKQPSPLQDTRDT